MNPEREKIGVLGFAGPERTKRDLMLQAEFNRLKPCQQNCGSYPVSRDFMRSVNGCGQNIGAVTENFRYRTQRDVVDQQTFNPWYAENRED